jgi:hypothetical protein
VPDPTVYRPVFSEGAAQLLIGLPKRRQQRLMDLAVQLAANPFVQSDYSVPDDSGRPIEHLLVEDFVFAYLIDHAAKEVRITDIEDAS